MVAHNAKVPLSNPLDAEILQEKAASLGRAGRRVEAALDALQAVAGEAPERPALVRDAARAVHHFFIQRELCGLRRHGDVIREMAIPKDVLARVGCQ
ncbi:DUF6665 family protein [Consotaella aegiceratis]|uniref:DUF6665 family protein n=1 Tax=Consotaella aegiceratis TaxID=3097961 RepID=UPI002F429ADC